MATRSPPDDIFDLEFRCAADDVWYSVRSILADDALTIQFKNFQEISFDTGDFDSFEKVDEFTWRIRAVSTQLQDNECYKIDKRMRVCACSSWREDDLRYYDVVEAYDTLEWLETQRRKHLKTEIKKESIRI